VRSFLKDHVHALTVDGQRDELHPKRDLTDEDRKLLGQVAWPDAPPENGPNPPYTTESWERPGQLIVWANPGTSGQFEKPDNWLINGSTAQSLDATEIWSGPSWGRSRGTALLGKETDILMPVAPSDYQVRGRGEYLARHITAEAHATLNNKLKGAYGNLWVSAAGRIDGGGNAWLRGVKHTFFINGDRHTGGPPATPEAYAALMDSCKHFARKWVVRKDDIAASVSLIGGFRSGDETHWLRGITILEEDSVISVGARCVQTVGLEAKMIMRSGSILGKNGNQFYKNDMLVKGELLAGTPDQPITRDVLLGISIKDTELRVIPDRSRRHIDDSYVRGLIVAPDGRVRVHTADPDKARLRITWHGSEPAGDDGSSGKQIDSLPPAERTINVNLLGDQVLNDVVFEYVGKDDIRLINPDVRSQWSRVDFGEHNTAEPQATFTALHPGEELSKQIAQWREEARGAAEIKGFYAGMSLFSQNQGTPTIDTPSGYYPAGDSIDVRLSNELEGIEIRYTIDGAEPSKDSTLYDSPFAIKQDTVIKAAGFKNGKQVGQTAQARFQFVAPGDVKLLASVNAGTTSPGLAYRFFKKAGKTMPDFDALEPAETGVATQLNIEAVGKQGDGFSLVFDGYLHVGETGVYNVHLDTARADACRVYIDDQLIVDNGTDDLDSVGLAGLEKGTHKLRVEFMDNGWRELIRLGLRKLDGSRKQPVTADMLSH